MTNTVRFGRSVRKINALIFLCFVLPMQLCAQNVVGKIIDQESNSPIEFAYVTIDQSNHMVSNEEGIFFFKNNLKNNDTSLLQINVLGYSQKDTVLRASLPDTITIAVTPVSIELDELVIEGKREKELKPREIVRIAIDSLYSDNSLTSNTMGGIYNQTHFSLLQSGNTSFGKYSYNPRLDTTRRYEYLIQANIDKQDGEVSVAHLRRSEDCRKYLHGYSSGKGKSIFIDYVANDSPEEKQKGVTREKEHYDLKNFFSINPVASFTKEVNREKSFYLSSGTYGYLNKQFIKRHTFKLDGITEYQGYLVAKIKILPARNSYKHGFFTKHHWIPVGYLYVRLKDFGILRMEYSYILNPKKTNFAAWVSSIELGLPILYKDVILYKEVDEELRLAYMSRFQRDIDVDKDNDEDLENKRYYYLEREFVVSRYTPLEDSPSSVKSLYDDYAYDEANWENIDEQVTKTTKFKKIAEDLENRAKMFLSDQFKTNSTNN